MTWTTYAGHRMVDLEKEWLQNVTRHTDVPWEPQVTVDVSDDIWLDQDTYRVDFVFGGDVAVEIKRGRSPTDTIHGKGRAMTRYTDYTYVFVDAGYRGHVPCDTRFDLSDYTGFAEWISDR